MKIAFDCSSIMWTCLSVGKDQEGFNAVTEDGKDYWINTQAYGYENAVNSIITSLKKFNLTPKDAILVFEGQSSKVMRGMIDKEYKAGRGKRPNEAYVEFNNLKGQLQSVFFKLGALSLTQDYVEGDDILGWLAQHTEEDLVIRSGDGDLAVLSGVNAYGATIHTSIGDRDLDENPFGPFENRWISVYKALVGDSSDNIKGIKGFGPAAFAEFYRDYGDAGLEELARLAEIGNLDELHPECGVKVVKKIFDGSAEFIKSWKLAKIHTEWVNTLQNPLKWSPGLIRGKVDDERLAKWQGQSHLVSGSKWESFKSWAKPLIARSDFVALDIETSTPDESDEWVESNGGIVDVIGSELSGMSLTFGDNLQYTVYIPVDHTDTDCVPLDDVADFAMNLGKQLVIQNVAFEGPVLYNAWGERFKNNSYEGYLPNWLDTKLEASYVNENESLGLKKLAKMYFGYDQVEYSAVTTLEGPIGTLQGGQLLSTFDKCVKEAVIREVTAADVEMESQKYAVAMDAWERDMRSLDCETPRPTATVLVEGGTIEVEPAVFEATERRQYKMRELSAAHVKSYACDDTIVTASLHNFFKLHMQLEHHWKVYLDVEIDASYLHAQSYVHGVKVDVAKLYELAELDAKTKVDAEAVLHKYLVTHGWEGTVAPVFEKLDAAAIKQAALICGQELKTAIRTPAKLVPMIQDKLLADLVSADDAAAVTCYVHRRFVAAPEFNAGSPKQITKLMYDVMGLPLRLFNNGPGTRSNEAIRNAMDVPLTLEAYNAMPPPPGARLPNPSTDTTAIAYALLDAPEEEKAALEALKLIKMVQTRSGLYYETYPKLVHWKTGRIHSNHNQCGTNTRRASSSAPNLQQLPKHAKIEGQAARFREVIVPHKRNAVIVSMDFSSQEILLLAEWSKDPVLREVFVGDSPKDMHSITGLGIYNGRNEAITYEQFVAAKDDKSNPLHEAVKKCRALGKAVNFGSQYRIKPGKLSRMLMVNKQDATDMLEAKAVAFPVAEAWAETEMAAIYEHGTVKTLLGAVRHLAKMIDQASSGDEEGPQRQALSFRIQGSAAEMTKLAEGRMWKARLEQVFDCEVIAPIHDECVFSVAVPDLVPFMGAAHACMVGDYAGMELPIKSSISFGPSFGEQIEIGDLPVEAAIVGGLKKMEKA